MRRSVRALTLTIVVLLFNFTHAYATECSIPNSFSAGTKAVAAQVNANFDAVKSAVDDNDSRIAALEAAITAMQTRITDLETENDNLIARLDAVEVDTVAGLGGVLSLGTDINGFDVALFEGVNVQIVNGTGTTEDTVTGTGNLIVGYNELRGSIYVDDRTGSHNIVIGRQHNYTSYGGLVVGHRNSIEGHYSSVSGGYRNTASAFCSSVSGGYHNTASANLSSVSGGALNIADSESASVSGGMGNVASGFIASVGGGLHNTASGEYSSVAGGYNNKAIENYVTIIGWSNIAGTQSPEGIYPYIWGGTWTRP